MLVTVSNIILVYIIVIVIIVILNFIYIAPLKTILQSAIARKK